MSTFTLPFLCLGLAMGPSPAAAPAPSNDTNAGPETAPEKQPRSVEDRLGDIFGDEGGASPAPTDEARTQDPPPTDAAAPPAAQPQLAPAPDAAVPPADTTPSATSNARDEGQGKAAEPDPGPSQADLEARRAAAPPPRSPWPEIPIRWRLELMVAGGTSSARHETYTFFDDENTRMPNSVIEVRADAKLAGPFFLGGGAAYRYGETENSSLFGAARTTLKLHEPRGFMRFSYAPVEGVDAYLQLAGGVSIADYTIDFDSYSDERTYAFVGDALAGTMLALPKRWLPRRGSSRVTGGIDLGMGYTYRTPLTIEPTVELDDDPISTQFSEFGKVQVRGFTWRLGLFVRFM